MATQKEKAALRGSIVDPNTADKLADLLALTGASPAASVAAIPAPASATAEACALKINQVIAALKAAGLMS